jgi:hypothetical protein
MRWVRQNPLTEDTCGQCSLAMLLAIGKREAIRRVGHDLGTTTREMATHLAQGGLRVAPRLARFRGFAAVPTPCALLLGFWRRYPHWFVWNDGRVFDPVEGIFDVRAAPLPRRLTVTHYLWLEPLKRARRARRVR